MALRGYPLKNIIAICGFISSGKGTVGDILVKDYNYTKHSFADSLKDSAAAIFGWSRHLLEGDTVESRQWREQVDTWWSDRLGIPHLTPRWILQHFGTEVARQHFHDDIWLASMENKLRVMEGSVVIPDCRFPNEIKIVRKLGGEIWWVRRGELPEWYRDACDANAGTTCKNYETAKQRMIERGIHDSETAWVGSKFDQIIDNDSDLSALQTKIRSLIPA